MKCTDRNLSVFFMWLYAVAVFLFSVTFFGVPAHAQLSIGNQGFSLTATPSLPEPYTEVSVSLDDYSVNAVGAAVFWFVNDVEQKDSHNARSITLNVGELGNKQDVRAELIRTDGSRINALRTITPTVVDLILEADTYVPSFYKGRALPGRTSMLQATAIVNDGEALPDEDYTYRWTIGQDVLFGGPVRGKNSVSFPMPLYSKELIVEVITPDGQAVARNSMKLVSVQPELYFYEWSPLRGLYQRAIPDSFSFVGDETTIHGEPFFVNTAPNNENSTISWSISEYITPSEIEAPRSLTLSRDILNTGDQIGLRILTKDTVPQILEKTFSVIKY